MYVFEELSRKLLRQVVQIWRIYTKEKHFIFISRQSRVLTLKQLNFLVHEKVIKVHKVLQAAGICRTRWWPANCKYTKKENRKTGKQRDYMELNQHAL